MQLSGKLVGGREYAAAEVQVAANSIKPSFFFKSKMPKSDRRIVIADITDASTPKRRGFLVYSPIPAPGIPAKPKTGAELACRSL
jgi:hypothetical protein